MILYILVKDFGIPDVFCYNSNKFRCFALGLVSLKINLLSPLVILVMQQHLRKNSNRNIDLLLICDQDKD